jgi:hypothetical protein
VLNTWDGGSVWYAGYGSNLDPDRFHRYLEGGRPPGATRTYPGARDRARPLDTRPFTMPGRLAFAWESPTWGGGIAFHEPDTDGSVLACAYLVTAGQLSDVLEQEMWREPGADLDLTEVVSARRHVIGPGRYETLHLAGELDGRPVVTFSSSDIDALGLRAPAPPYVATIARGLRKIHDLPDAEIVDYLLASRGVDLAWDRRTLAEAVA